MTQTRSCEAGTQLCVARGKGDVCPESGVEGKVHLPIHKYLGAPTLCQAQPRAPGAKKQGSH